MTTLTEACRLLVWLVTAAVFAVLAPVLLALTAVVVLAAALFIPRREERA